MNKSKESDSDSSCDWSVIAAQDQQNTKELAKGPEDLKEEFEVKLPKNKLDFCNDVNKSIDVRDGVSKPVLVLGKFEEFVRDAVYNPKRGRRVPLAKMLPMSVIEATAGPLMPIKPDVADGASRPGSKKLSVMDQNCASGNALATGKNEIKLYRNDLMERIDTDTSCDTEYEALIMRRQLSLCVVNKDWKKSTNGKNTNNLRESKETDMTLSEKLKFWYKKNADEKDDEEYTDENAGEDADDEHEDDCDGSFVFIENEAEDSN